MILSELKLPKRQPRYFLSESFDAGNERDVKEVLNRLLSETPSDFRSATQWFGLFSEASSAISELQTHLEVAVQRNTNDKESEKKLQFFDERILSQMLRVRAHLIDIYLSSPWRASMHADDRGRIAADFQNRRRYTSASLVELQLTENQLIRQYRQFMSAAVTDFRGRQLQLSVIVGKLNDNSAETRKDAFFSYWSYIEEHESELQDLFQKLLENRNNQALTLGEQSYIPLAFAELGRLDYSVEDCKKFRDSISEHVIPVTNELAKYQALNLRTRTVKPWDVNAWPQLAPTCSPANGNLEDMLDGFQRMLKKIHPSFESMYIELKQRNLIDVEPRKNKAAGAFCVTFQESGLPFIFGNFAGTLRDGLTLVHEFGHAIHGIATAPIANVLLRHPGLEFCEVASLGLEMFASQHFSEWWSDAENAQRAWANQAFHAIQFWPFMAMIDEFQHSIYSQSQCDALARNRVWTSLSRRFRPHVDWSECENFEKLGWFSRQHIFTSPFYYIDYGIAQLGAVQLWQNAKKDPETAVQKYILALSLGAQRNLPELFQEAGLELDFEGHCLAGLVRDLKKEVMQIVIR